MEEFKYHYKYPHPSVTTDCVIFGFDGTRLNILLVERGIEPYKGRWAFPGGFLKMEEIAKRVGYRNGNSVKSKKKKVLMKIMEMKERADFKDLPAAA